SQKQLELPTAHTWGGARPGSGPKPRPGRPFMSHATRGAHVSRYPVQVTMRATSRLPSLRSSAVFPAVKRAITRSSRYPFRVVYYSVQQDHLHLIVEGDTPSALRSGVQGLAIRVAVAVNGALGRRGKVWGDRYHARALRTPCEVRNSLL